MMQSAHSPTPPPNGMPATEEFDDPFPSASLDDLALNNGDENNEGDKEGEGNAADAAANNEADPWAVLAAAAGEEAPTPAAAAPSPTTTTAAADATSPSEPSIAPIETTTLAHAEGETFTMPTTTNDNNKPPLAALSSAISSKIHEVDTNIGLSTKVRSIDEQYQISQKLSDFNENISTKARSVDEQYHISQKLSEFNENVLKPTTAKTVEKTKEVSSSVKEKVGPTVSEKWGSIKQRTVEIGVAQKWGEISSATSNKWSETKDSIVHWREEQEKKKALTPVAGSGGGGGGLDLEVAKEKVVEGWTGGVTWVSQKIQDAKLQHQQQQQQGGGQMNGSSGGEREMNRLDSQGFPSSFQKDG